VREKKSTSSSHSWGVDFEIPSSKEAPAPLMIPALLDRVRSALNLRGGMTNVLDKNIDLSIANFCNFLSDALPA
jgi:hypothetical protein